MKPSEPIKQPPAKETPKPVSPQNRATHEQYKDTLRADMQKPVVKDPELQSIVNQLYRKGATIVSGSSAAALRYERQTGQQVGGGFHKQKVEERLVQLKRWIKNNPNADSQDKAAAENLIRDMENALQGN